MSFPEQLRFISHDKSIIDPRDWFVIDRFSPKLLVKSLLVDHVSIYADALVSGPELVLNYFLPKWLSVLRIRLPAGFFLSPAVIFDEDQMSVEPVLMRVFLEKLLLDRRITIRRYVLNVLEGLRNEISCADAFAQLHLHRVEPLHSAHHELKLLPHLLLDQSLVIWVQLEQAVDINSQNTGRVSVCDRVVYDRHLSVVKFLTKPLALG